MMILNYRISVGGQIDYPRSVHFTTLTTYHNLLLARNHGGHVLRLGNQHLLLLLLQLLFFAVSFVEQGRGQPRSSIVTIAATATATTAHGNAPRNSGNFVVLFLQRRFHHFDDRFVVRNQLGDVLLQRLHVLAVQIVRCRWRRTVVGVQIRCTVAVGAGATAPTPTRSNAVVVLLLQVVVGHDDRPGHAAAASDLELGRQLGIEFGVECRIVELGLVRLFHQQLGRVHPVVHRRSAVDHNVRPAVAELLVVNVRAAERTVLVEVHANVLALALGCVRSGSAVFVQVALRFERDAARVAPERPLVRVPPDVLLQDGRFATVHRAVRAHIAAGGRRRCRRHHFTTHHWPTVGVEQRRTVGTFVRD